VAREDEQNTAVADAAVERDDGDAVARLEAEVAARPAARRRAMPRKASKTAKPKEQKMVGFRPLHDRVLVRRIEAEEKTPGGIIIPDTAKEKPVEAEVLAVGPGARSEDGKLHPLDVKQGDRVLFGKWAGTEVVIEGEDRLILKESDILGVIEGSGRVSARAA
jgi:chaperonin GroES